MKKAKVKIPAKINLNLDVIGTSGGYHEIYSLVCSVSVYDEIVARKREDGRITLTEKGLSSECEEKDNNAYKAAAAFIKEYNTTGADIIIVKNIPVGGGLGGSSADIAGTLIALKKLYGVNEDILPLANSLGSDSGYMTIGGAAVISGRGEKVERLEKIPTLYLILLTEKEKCTSKDSYRAYDELGVKRESTTYKSVKAIKENDLKGFYSLLKNDLEAGSIKLVPQIKDNIKALNDSGAEVSLMTGSGSCVFGIYKDKKTRNTAYKKLYKSFGEKLIKAETIC